MGYRGTNAGAEENFSVRGSHVLSAANVVPIATKTQGTAKPYFRC